jgi:hypothetical protein
MNIKIEWIDGEVVECTLEEFCEANADAMPAPQSDIIEAIESDGAFYGGGGACPEFSIKRI